MDLTNSISWLDFTAAVSVTSIFYYFIVIIKFYNHDIRHWFSKLTGKAKLLGTEPRPGNQEDEVLKEEAFSSEDQDEEYPNE